MSLAKYMQLYREYGFFNGSTIRVRIPDTSFYGSDLILSKDGNILRTRTIDDDVVDFFTDESGTLVLSADNGSATLSGEVKISAYGTYNITLEGASVDKSREVYAEKDVTLDDGKTTDSVAIGYTGDISPISAISSNTSVCTVSVNGNKVIVRDAGKDFNGKSTITATVEASQNYDAGEVNFYVNKTNGRYDTWQDASDEVIASMIAEADAGEIDLSDFWHLGDTRTIHLEAIEAGTEVSAQSEQDVELVILHNPEDSIYYRLTTPTAGYRYQPNFIIGTKDCLAIPSSMGYIQNTIIATSTRGSYSYTKSFTAYTSTIDTDEAELLSWLNDDFIDALPAGLKNSLKFTNRYYTCERTTNKGYTYGNYTDDYGTFFNRGIKSHKVSLANIKELGFSSQLTGTDRYVPNGTGAYVGSGELDEKVSPQIASDANSAINNCGEKFQYFTNGGSIQKKKGISGNNIDYLVPDAFIFVSAGQSNSYGINLASCYYMSANATLTTNVLTTEAERVAQRGVAPIMFI